MPPVMLKTLFVQRDGAVVRIQQDTVLVTVEGEKVLRVPFHMIESIVGIGRVSFTSPLLERCAAEGRSVVRMTRGGRFLYRIEGRLSGNVLLRAAQHEASRSPDKSLAIMRAIVAAKVHNQRQLLLKASRDVAEPADRDAVRSAVDDLARELRKLRSATDPDEVRGIEGVSARRYFAALRHLLAPSVRQDLAFDGRNRRPPRDPVNAVLSFLYAMLMRDAESALLGVGLDPQVGFLHTLRPGRPSLALDLMEEMRPVLADRVMLSMFNRRQLQQADFETLPGGAIELGEAGRKTVFAEWDRRREREIEHPLLRQPVPYGRLLDIQARMLARAIRSQDLGYTPFLYRG
ncbi:type I-C CRISPR-associated endonuclease Cas1c [Alicyclobacillus mali (ex Roth et al. 2021)]|uniref:type I-C CRISPR-associated endonuclease Cas1c n=1 Tax=Alicyclobacillus mali (ex Roth et al. 2021) TaxID=1123961 RepID=UPI000834FB4B|nr:type I-C CRISPR-associated endonuclease Cas1c [Alicyclobacillus mali (ex Roth et al. 2021)]MCL6489067.1 type I-C CRISPR-associated endonuclease Cas1c [Alicyclobacillus mali (ex Roth et al. 2021)]